MFCYLLTQVLFTFGYVGSAALCKNLFSHVKMLEGGKGETIEKQQVCMEVCK